MTARIPTTNCENCTILTLFNLDNGKEKPRIRVDCVNPCRADSTVERHRQDGYVELQDSRSELVSMQDNDTIRVYLKGNIQLPKGVPKGICILKFFKHASSSHITFPVERVKSRSYYGEVEYSMKRTFTTHSVRFDLRKKKMRNLLRMKAAQIHKDSILSEKGLLILGRQLTWDDWEKVGLGLGIQQSDLDDIEISSIPERRPVRLLASWTDTCTGMGESDMAEDLATVLDDNGYGYVASVVRKVIDENRCIESKDFYNGV